MIIDIHKYLHITLLIAAVICALLSIANNYPLEYAYSSTLIVVLSAMLLYFSTEFKSLRFKNYIFQIFSFSIVLSVHLPIINHFINYKNPLYRNLVQGIRSEFFLNASLFITLYILVFCITLKFISFSSSKRFQKPLGVALKETYILRFSYIIIVSELLLLAADVFLGASNPENTARIGFITRFIPRDIFFFSAIFLIVNISKDSKARKVLYIYIVVFLIKSMLIGVRGAFILPFFMGFFVLVFAFPFKKIDKRYLSYVGVVILLLPIYLSLASVFKSNIRSDVSDRKAVVISDNVNSMDLENVVNWIFGRFQGYIYLVKSMSETSPEIKKYINLANITDSTLGSILPDRIYPSNVPSLGKVSSVFFNGLPWDYNNAGAMFIFALFWLWLGWLGIFITPILLFVVGFFRYFFFDPLSYRKVITCLYLVWIFFFSFTISGNIDYLIASLITNLVAFNVILATFRIYKI